MKDLTNELLTGSNLLAESVDQVETNAAIQEELQSMADPASLFAESVEDMLFSEDARIDGNTIEMPSDAGIDSLQFFNQDNVGQSVADSTLTGLDPDRQDDFGNAAFAASNPKGKSVVQLRSVGDNVALGEGSVPSLFTEDEAEETDAAEIADGIDDQTNTIGDDDSALEESLKLFKEEDEEDDDSDSDIEEDDEDEEYDEDDLGF